MADAVIPRFDASDFVAVTPDMKRAFERDGVLVLEHLVPEALCDALRARMQSIIEEADPAKQASIFSTTSQAHAQDAYFLGSGHRVRFFFEEEAFGKDGALVQPVEQALNKVGHAMHDTDAVFSRFSRQPALKVLAEGLGQKEPLIAQSMYIFKPPHIGGEVICHQDATFIRTEPNSCLGLWFALEDATEENGCLFGIPGGHEGTEPKAKFIREGDSTRMELLDDSPFEEARRVSLPAKKGTVIAFGGLFPHLSAANRSAKSRHAYTLHLIDGSAHYPADNWLQRPADMPFKGF